MMMIPDEFRRIALVAPAGKLAPDAVENGVRFLEAHEKIVRLMPHVLAPSPVRYLAADAAARARELADAWLDPATDLLLAVRGGFGSAHLLPLLDWRQLATRNVPLIGYSDITALHFGMLSYRAGRPVAGPMLGKLAVADQCAYTRNHFHAALARLPREITPPEEFGPYQILCSTSASGPVIAANLAVAVSLLGTAYFPDPTGAILVLEDLNEPIYKLDRYLTQLELAGVFDRISGLIFGQFTDCAAPAELETLFGRVAGKHHDIPVLMNFPFGHTFPFASLDLTMHLTVENGRVFAG